jgi:hypothetical protein
MLLFPAASFATGQRTIDEIPAHCSKILSKFDLCEPLSPRPHRDLWLKNLGDCLLLESLSESASARNKGAWRLTTFDAEETSHHYEDQGIRLHLDPRLPPCSLQDLQHAFGQILAEFKRGWYEADIKDHPRILFQHPEELYVLFIKASSAPRDHILCSRLATTLGLGESSVFCHNLWRQAEEIIAKNKTYLFIKRADFRRVMTLMKFELRTADDHHFWFFN